MWITDIYNLVLGNATVAVKLLDKDMNKRKYYELSLHTVGGNVIRIQIYENIIATGFLFGAYHIQCKLRFG